VLGALILQLLQSWFLQDLSQWLHALGRVTGIGFLEQIELVQSIELIFGIILVVMMLYRREGLIPAQRTVTALSFEEQTAVPSRGGISAKFAVARPIGRPATPLLEVRGLRKAYGASRRCRMSISPSGPAASSRSSAPTARARRRCST